MSGRTFLFAFLLLAGAMLAGLRGKPSSTPQPPIVLSHVSVVDVRAGQLLPEQTVVVERGRITEVGPPDTVKPPAGAKIVTANGKYLIPGLWDMHVHAAWPYLDEIFARLFVANGVTGVREMFGSMETISAWKAHFESGESWPRMIGAGHILDGQSA